MPNITPVQLFPGFEYKAAAEAVTADSIVIPLAALPALTALEADPAGGDGREVLHALIDGANTRYSAIATASRPTKMNLTKGTIQGLNATEYRKTYTTTFDCTDTSSSGNLSPEA
jgi:hypothetical protein